MNIRKSGSCKQLIFDESMESAWGYNPELYHLLLITS